MACMPAFGGDVDDVFNDSGLDEFLQVQKFLQTCIKELKGKVIFGNEKINWMRWEED